VVMPCLCWFGQVHSVVFGWGCWCHDRLSLDLKPPSPAWRGRAQQKKGGTLDKTRHNAVWASNSGDTTNRRRWELNSQLAVADWLRRGQMGRAQQQFALLRRCFYPKRDVIKWAGTWMGPSLEVNKTSPWSQLNLC
jgi:hypothetical protein